jgi:superfamily II DNA/RNA helicase
VINYSIPRELEVYVHRIGRTARSGKSGIAISLVTSSHKKLVHQIERITKSKMLEMRAPSPSEIAKRKIAALLPTLLEAEKTERYAELLSDDWKKALSELTAEQVALRFLALRFPEVAGERPTPAIAMRDGREERPQVPRPPRPAPNGVIVTLSSAAREQMDLGKRPRFERKTRHELTKEAPRVERTPSPHAPVIREERKPKFKSKVSEFEGKLYSDEASTHLTAEPRRKPRTFDRDQGSKMFAEGPRPFRKAAFGTKPAFSGKPRFGGKPAFRKPKFGAKPAFGKKPYPRAES